LQNKQNNKNHGHSFNIEDINSTAHTLPANYANNYGGQILIPEISRWTPYRRVAGIDEQANTITAQYGTNGVATPPFVPYW